MITSSGVGILASKAAVPNKISSNALSLAAGAVNESISIVEVGMYPSASITTGVDVIPQENVIAPGVSLIVS